MKRSIFIIVFSLLSMLSYSQKLESLKGVLFTTLEANRAAVGMKSNAQGQMDSLSVVCDTLSERLVRAIISGGGAGVWGSITGTLAEQTDLTTKFATKADTSAVYSRSQTDTKYLKTTDTVQIYVATKQYVDSVSSHQTVLEDFDNTIIKAFPIGFNNNLLYAAMADGFEYYTPFNVKDTITTIGVTWATQTAGNYTGTQCQIKLASVSGTVATVIDSIANNTELWKATASTKQTSVWLHGPHTLQKGKYVVLSIYKESAQTTAPSLYAMTSQNWMTEQLKVDGFFWMGYWSGKTRIENITDLSTSSRTNKYFLFFMY